MVKTALCDKFVKVFRKLSKKDTKNGLAQWQARLEGVVLPRINKLCLGFCL